MIVGEDDGHERPKCAHALPAPRRQRARSFELRAALALGRRHWANGRRADAQAVLVPALEGFAPMAEMPEIARAQELLAEVSR